jgi:hypothetical protein
MNRRNRWLIVTMSVVCLLLAACGSAPATTEEPRPATVERLQGSQPTRVTLTEEAAKHLDLGTAAVASVQLNGKAVTAIPYAAVVYDTEGNTWAYVSTKPNVFVRDPISVDHINGDLAYLTKGPDAGAEVVTTGAEELFGAESEFAEE